ncbi:hypothetical protein C7974DRAFT_74375 [Boeremia exigua]|uniref:uncharacterized protein n=1 Tax=Boeremia exigua TaxID=749465 RepID=UPI001E8E5074|nr:uncharacterized protein C7974DRAFT_74375 [Boeremia exigua]KAH6614333.1 hypothetical protein C7974DRAFT_74375 [Boeremia exigua]
MSFGISIGDLLKLGEIAGRVYKNCRDCTGDYKSLTTEARSLTNLLDDIQDKFEKIPPHKREQLREAYDPCVNVLSELDKLLEHYNSLDTKSKRAWDRLKWDPEKSRSLRERLASSVAMLNAFYISVIHDNQVLILEALERLELDYKGGCREESIASIERIAAQDGQEEEDDDAAWSQIIRDLEDVGISQQVAFTYHDFVVDWFIRAVNEGRLLEERRDPESLNSTRRSSAAFQVDFLSSSLAATTLDTKSDTVHTEVLAQPTIIKTLHRTDSSNAPELLHVMDPLTEIYKEAYLPDPSHSAPEPVHVSSPSDLAPEPMHGKNGELSTGFFWPSNLASEAPQPVSSVAPSNLHETAQQIVAAWTRRDFPTATELLEQQLAAVELGFVTSNGLQPDRRVLRHCIGVCASFGGNFTKAKHFFESAFNGLYLIKNLDEGDIAAARWLGDVCLQLHEFHNTVLAWSVALEGSIRRYGLTHDRTRHLVQEMLKLDEWVSAFKDINGYFLANVDPTDIFSSTHALEKSDLVRATQARVTEGQPRSSQARSGRPTAALRPRPRLEMIPAEAFFTAPLVSSGAWPLPWDATFSPMAVFQTYWYLKLAEPVQSALSTRPLRWKSLGESKKLDYVTKAGSAWLVETVKAILRELEIEHAEHPDENAIVCCLNRDHDGVASSEGVLIGFWKVQFRNVCGVKISNVKWSTRKPPPMYGTRSLMDFDAPVDTLEIRDTIKEMLELAENRPHVAAPIDEKASVQSSSRSWKPWGSSKATMSLS